MFAFSRFRTRLIVFLLGLLIPMLGGIFYYVNNNNNQYTQETINSYLQLGADVFDFTRDERTQTLFTIINSLTFDFGFRTAFASRDIGTLFDAALNVMERSLGSVDMLLLTDLDLNVLIDTETQGFEVLEAQWAEMIYIAEESENGLSEAIITIAGEPYQLIAVPLYLPRQVAWIIGGFRLNEEFVGQVQQNILSEVSILRLDPERNEYRANELENAVTLGADPVEVIASTLEVSDQQFLAEKFVLTEEILNTPQGITLSTGEFSSLARTLYRDPTTGREIVALIQRSYDENSENVLQFRRLLIQFYLLAFALSLLAVIFLARSITNPLTKLAQLVQRIEGGDYDNSVEIHSRDEIGTLADSVNSMAKGLSEKEKVRDLLGKVVSHQIAEELLSNPVELGGEEKIVTVLFVDIKGFTNYCEGKSPQQVLSVLNKFLSRISNIIEKHSGVVDKYNGDAVMALFGAPVSGEQDVKDALMATLEIISALTEMVEDESPDEYKISACVGVHTGLVVAGNLGSQNRLNYSVIGDTVNLAARLESLTRLYGVTNIVSEESALAAPNFVYRELDQVRVFGRNQAVKIFELLGPPGSLTPAQEQELLALAEARESYINAEWLVAKAKFETLIRQYGQLAIYQMFIDRIDKLSSRALSEEWDGIYTFGKK